MNIVSTSKFSIREALKYGFTTCINNPILFLQLIVLAFVIYYDSSFINLIFIKNTIRGQFVRAVSMFFIAIIKGIFTLYLTIISLSIVDKKQPAFASLWTYNHMIIKSLYAQFVYLTLIIWGSGSFIIPSLIVSSTYNYIITKSLYAQFIYFTLIICGTVCCIVPGLTTATVYYFFLYKIVDTNGSINESLDESRKITQGSAWKIFGYICLCYILTAVSLNILLPVVYVSSAYIYRKLQPIK